jgi:integrase
MVLFAVHTGIRLSDSASLTWARIDVEQSLLRYTAKKTGTKIQVPLHNDLLQYLETIPAGDEPNAPLFPSLAGRATGGGNGLSAAFGRLLISAEIDSPLGAEKTGRGRQLKALSFHSLRHSAASRLGNSGVSIDTSKNILGHTSDAVHEKYRHTDLTREREAISRQTSLLCSP